MLGAVFLKSWKMAYITPTLGGLTKTYSPPDLFLVVARQEARPASREQRATEREVSSAIALSSETRFSIHSLTLNTTPIFLLLSLAWL